MKVGSPFNRAAAKLGTRCIILATPALTCQTHSEKRSGHMRASTLVPAVGPSAVSASPPAGQQNWTHREPPCVIGSKLLWILPKQLYSKIFHLVNHLPQRPRCNI